MHRFAVRSITWRALPAEHGRWNGVWKRFPRLSRSGVFEAFFQALAEPSPAAHRVQVPDRAVVRAQVPAQGGLRRPAARPSPDRGRGRQQHAAANLARHRADVRPRAALADKGGDARANRAACRARGLAAVIPHRANARNRPASLPRLLDRQFAATTKPSQVWLADTA